MAEQNKGVDAEVLADAALERVRPDLAMLKVDEVLQVNLDITAAVATVLGTLPELKALREQIAKELPTFGLEQFDKLRTTRTRSAFANAKYLAATQPPDDLEEVSVESARLREVLLSEVTTLVRHGIVGGSQLEQLKGANGYKNVATDLMILVDVLKSVWSQIQGKTLTTQQDLEQALRLGTRLLRIVGLREQGPAVVAEATDLRLRAYTKLFLAYEDARRAVAYLRADAGDADEIAPALHPGHPRRRQAEANSGGPPATVTTPTPAPSTSGTVAAGGASGGATAGAPAAPAPANNAAGISGPFVV